MNVFAVIFRNISKHRLFFAVSTICLSIAMSTAMLLLMHIQFEKSFDDFYKNTDDIYRINYHVSKSGKQLVNTCRTQSALAGVLLNESELFEAAGRAYYEECYMYTDDVKLYGQHVVWADSAFINVFQHNMILGNSSSALAGQYSVVISDVVAQKYFGSENPIGKIIKLNEGIPFAVTGVFKSLPKNTHLYYDFMVSYVTLEHWGMKREGHWRGVFTSTYARKKSNTTERQINDLLINIADKYLANDRKDGQELAYTIMPVKDIYLHSTQDKEFKPQGNLLKVNLLLVIAIFIVVIAWANNINVFTALSFERLKDACIRKINGAHNVNLISYNIKESLLVNFAAVFLALLTIALVFPFYKHGVNHQVNAEAFTQLWFWGVFAAFLLLGTLITSSISIAIHSSFKPLQVLNNNLNKGFSFGSVRQALVVFQFMLAIILIVSTIVVFKQIIFLESSDLGMNPKQVLVMRAPATNNTTGPKRYQDFCAFREEVMQLAHVKSVTATLNIPGQTNRMSNIAVSYRGERLDALFNLANADNNYFETFQVPITAGRNFYNNIDNENQSVIINEKAAQTLGFNTAQDAIGERISLRNSELEIIGVVQNFHHESLQKELEPYIYQFIHPKEFGYYPVQVVSTNINELTKSIEKIWYKHYPDAQADFFFLDAYFNKQYLSYKQLAQLGGISALLAIFIACLGLFALASYAVNKKVKEIGVRKVNGASIFEIVSMLNRGFVKWVFVAYILAFPIAYFAMHKWLANFAYKTELSWWIFALAGVLALGIALLTVSFQSWKAATRNPVEALRYE